MRIKTNIRAGLSGSTRCGGGTRCGGTRCGGGGGTVSPNLPLAV